MGCMATPCKMKFLLFILLFFASSAWAAEKPLVEKCFKVQSLIKADPEHYWATWKNACPYIIDSIYVNVDFKDKAGSILGHGVWSLHYVKPGEGRYIRFSTPSLTSNYFSVILKEITLDAFKALRY